MGKPHKESIAHAERDRQKAITRFLSGKIKEAEQATAQAMGDAVERRYWSVEETPTGISGGVAAHTAYWVTDVIQRPTYTQSDVDYLHVRIAELERSLAERDELIEALSEEIGQIDDGWIEWSPGSSNASPVGAAVTEVRLRGGTEWTGVYARPGTSWSWCWTREAGNSEIVAYRVIG